MVKFQIIAGEACLDFINTLDNRSVPEKLQELVPTFAELTEWALQAGVLSPTRARRLLRPTADHSQQASESHARAIDLRECLYRIFTAVALDKKVSGDDLRLFNAYLKEAQAQLALFAERGAFRLDWPADTDFDFILWRIAVSARDLLTGQDRKNIRECGVDSCRWLFVDRSKNHSRRWCDMRVCGNRIKAQNFYRKRSKALRRTKAAR